ncbi:MAG: DUF1801 domain-containing protein [Firmicutes bacterium]|nr:DUF1801 domain-containing protein [Bacillota bacterium]
MRQTNPKVDAFIDRAKTWQEEYKKLRAIALDSELTEDVKWGVPCYTLNQSNVILIHGFKEYVGMLFIKGALLKDEKNILIQQTENVQAARQARFTNTKDIDDLEQTIKSYIKEAIENEKAGLKVALKKETDLVYPEEFQKELDASKELRIAFDALTPGRKRAYNLYFSSPKQSKTRESRIESSKSKILEGKGLND